MVKDTLNSILDNLKERTTNPFLGTLIVVWLVKNWKLVYSLFYFDNSFKLNQHLEYISVYFQNTSFIWNMVGVIFITLGVLILTYILLSLSRLITDGQEKIILPIISRWTDKSSIVLKSEYIKRQEVIRLLEIRLEEERQAKINIQNERDRLDEKLSSIDSKNNTPNLDQFDREFPQETNHFTENYSFKRVSNIIIIKWSIEEFNEYVSYILTGKQGYFLRG